MISVYILYSKSIEKYYVGQTSNLQNRILQHNSGESKYTSKGMPWEIVKSVSVESRA